MIINSPSSEFPYEEVKIGDNVSIRIFYACMEPEDLIWHWDTEDRDMHVLQAGGWGYEQEGGKLIKLTDGYRHRIPEATWHRITKGDNDLIVEVTKSESKGLKPDEETFGR